MAEFNTALWGGGAPLLQGVTVTAGSIIYGALRLLTVLRPGQIAGSDSLADGLVLLNEMIDSWNTERLVVHAIARSVYDLTPNQGTYTLGIGGGFDAVRPQRIDHAGLISGESEHPVDILNTGQWAGIVSKRQHGSPCKLYCDGAYPLINLELNPVPSAADQLALYTWQSLEGFADQDTEYAFPPGYALALRYGLACVMAPAFIVIAKLPQPLLNMIEAKAADYKAKIKSLNAPVMTLQCDASLGGFTDYSYRY